MRLRRVLWLLFLLPQYALLLLFIYGDLRELRHELQFGHPQMMTQCIPYPPFNPANFGCEIVGIAGLVGLCGFRRPGRWLYAVFVGGLLAISLPDFIRSAATDRFTWIMYVVVATTLALCFTWLFPVSAVPLGSRPAS